MKTRVAGRLGQRRVTQCSGWAPRRLLMCNYYSVFLPWSLSLLILFVSHWHSFSITCQSQLPTLSFEDFLKGPLRVCGVQTTRNCSRFHPIILFSLEEICNFFPCILSPLLLHSCPFHSVLSLQMHCCYAGRPSRRIVWLMSFSASVSFSFFDDDEASATIEEKWRQ
jgi:hypothetical protein